MSYLNRYSALTLLVGGLPLLVATLGGCTDCRDPANGNKCRKSPIGSRLDQAGAPAITSTGGTGGGGGTLSAGGTGGSGARAGSGTGGSGGRGSGGSGGSGGEGASGPIVASIDFEDSAVDGWQVDNEKVHDGSFAAHPPDLPDDGHATLTLDCGGVDHTLLNFWYSSEPAAGQKLEFFVDGRLYEELPPTQYGYYTLRQIAVPVGPHEYSWEASVAAGGQPKFYLDDVRCFEFEQLDPSGRTDFDDGFVPLEVTGSWDVDSFKPHGDSDPGEQELAARPPLLDDFGGAWMTVSCPHEDATLLGFSYAAGLAPGQELFLELNGKRYDPLPSTQYEYYTPFWLVTKPGAHSLTFNFSTDAGGLPHVWVDTVTCRAVEPPPVTGRIDFDDGAVPTNVSGDWVIDSKKAHGDGVASPYELSARPPELTADDHAEFVVTCDDPHSKIEFYYASSAGAGQHFSFSSTDASADLPPTQYEYFTLYTVQSSASKYTFTVTTAASGRPPVWLDTINCVP
jgi:hypothetical protein